MYGQLLEGYRGIGAGWTIDVYQAEERRKTGADRVV